MPISRRHLLSNLAAGAVSGMAFHELSGFSLSELPSSARLGSAADPILLDRNENAYGPSEKVLAVIREALSGANRYARTEYDSLVNKIAALHRVGPEQIVLGCGCSEILHMATAIFLGRGKKLIQAWPTLPLLSQFAQRVGAEVINVPLNIMYEHDLDAMLARAGASTGLMYICNPNNPTGTITPRKDIETLVRKLPAKMMLLVDEAYHHYVGRTSSYVSFLDRPSDDSRVIVARTFSKIYGLAGMRVGYAFASANIATRLRARRLESGISALSAKAAAAALDDSEYVLLAAKRNANDRQEFLNHVNARMLRTIDSHTNFVMLNGLRPVDEVLTHLKQNNILVGPRIPVLDTFIRVSLGTPTEMLEFWRVWNLLPPHKM
jgi:histidinol-phosphate aminotransferase